MLFLLTTLVTLVVGSAANGAVQDASAFSYVVAVAIANNEASVYTVRNATGLVHSSQSTSDAVQFAVDDLPYYAITIDRNSVEIRGENSGGDLFFASDSYYNGFANKTATTVYATGDYDAFAIGTSAVCRGS
eukprot:gene28334-15146_t